MEVFSVYHHAVCYYLLHFVAFFHVASLFVRKVENRKVGVDNKKALELKNGMVLLCISLY